MFNRITGKPRRATAIIAIAFSAMLALSACNDVEDDGIDDGGLNIGNTVAETIDN